jgi:hypothetical protein
MDYEAGGMPVVSPECFWPGFRWLTSFAAWQTSEAISYKLIQHLSIKSRSVLYCHSDLPCHFFLMMQNISKPFKLWLAQAVVASVSSVTVVRLQHKSGKIE